MESFCWLLQFSISNRSQTCYKCSIARKICASSFCPPLIWWRTFLFVLLDKITNQLFNSLTEVFFSYLLVFTSNIPGDSKIFMFQSKKERRKCWASDFFPGLNFIFRTCANMYTNVIRICLDDWFWDLLYYFICHGYNFLSCSRVNFLFVYVPLQCVTQPVFNIMCQCFFIW